MQTYVCRDFRVYSNRSIYSTQNRVTLGLQPSAMCLEIRLHTQQTHLYAYSAISSLLFVLSPAQEFKVQHRVSAHCAVQHTAGTEIYQSKTKAKQQRGKSVCELNEVKMTGDRSKIFPIRLIQPSSIRKH